MVELITGGREGGGREGCRVKREKVRGTVVVVVEEVQVVWKGEGREKDNGGGGDGRKNEGLREREGKEKGRLENEDVKGGEERKMEGRKEGGGRKNEGMEIKWR